MESVRSVFYRLVSPTPCFDCRCFPCRCVLVLKPRLEACVCGGSIGVADSSDALAVLDAVKAHNSGSEHVAWRAGSE